MNAGAVHRYLDEVLGLSVQPRPWRGAADLPYYLRDAYDIAEIELLGVPCLLVMSRSPLSPERDVRKHLDLIANHADVGSALILVLDTMSSRERRNLIAKHIAFIVPGKQMYLPPLGIDLRERFVAGAPAQTDALSPATQALLLQALLDGDLDFDPKPLEVHPEHLNEAFGYTAMTMSRASRELESAKLVTAFALGRQKWLRFNGSPNDVWHWAQPWLRSPVQRSEWILRRPEQLATAPLAGLSALAHRTALADPPNAVVAVSSAQWKHIKRHAFVLPAAEPGAVHVQLWRYDPEPLSRDGVVDPLSLLLSLQDDPDERVQQAVAQFEEQLRW